MPLQSDKKKQPHEYGSNRAFHRYNVKKSRLCAKGCITLHKVTHFFKIESCTQLHKIGRCNSTTQNSEASDRGVPSSVVQATPRYRKSVVDTGRWLDTVFLGDRAWVMCTGFDMGPTDTPGRRLHGIQCMLAKQKEWHSSPKSRRPFLSHI